MSQVAGKMRRGPTAGQRWPEMGSAQLNLNTPCWWRRLAARSSPAAWRTTVGLISWAKCRLDLNANQGLDFPDTDTQHLWFLHLHTRAHTHMTHTDRHTHLNHEVPLLELSLTVAPIVLWIKYWFLKLNGSTWMCHISNVDRFISEKLCPLKEIWKYLLGFGFA